LPLWNTLYAAAGGGGLGVAGARKVRVLICKKETTLRCRSPGTTGRFGARVLKGYIAGGFLRVIELRMGMWSLACAVGGRIASSSKRVGLDYRGPHNVVVPPQLIKVRGLAKCDSDVMMPQTCTSASPLLANNSILHKRVSHRKTETHPCSSLGILCVYTCVCEGFACICACLFTFSIRLALACAAYKV